MELVKKVSKDCNVALVRWPIVFREGAVNNEATPAVAYAYISAYLRKKGYKTVMVDAIGEGINKIWKLKKYPGFKCQGLTFKEIIHRIPKEVDVIGFSTMFSGEWPVIRDFIIETRKHFPKALFVAGGEHITALTEYSLRDCPALDVCIRGEGEETFYQLLEVYRKKKTFKGVNGVGYLDKKGRYQQGKGIRRIEDINTIPWPHWPEGYLEKFWESERSYGISTKRDMPLLFSRGCPYQCKFCSNITMWGHKYKLRDIDDIIKEVKHYIKKYNITSIQLYDLTAIVSKDWIIKFCQSVIKEGIKLNWSLPSGTRSEALDKETLSLLKKIGFNYLVYAPESGSQKTLNIVKKQIQLKKITQSILEAKRQGLTLRANLIIAFPHERLWDIFKTLSYGLRLSIKGVDEVPLFIFYPYPGTEIFQKLLDKKKIVLNDDFFFKLNPLNSDYLSTNVLSYNPHISARMLGIIRTIFMLMNYGIGYLFYPQRIFRTIKNLFSKGKATTVFEHRLKNLFSRKFSEKRCIN